MNDPRSSFIDPSNGVPPALLQHIHLVSTYPFPSMANVNLDTIVDYLLQAPKIAKEVAPMSWMFLDAPRDGSAMLIWQALAQLSTRSASDGYVWADPEQAFSQEHKGYIIEMYVHRSGYAPGKENETSHSRRRYRLTPLPNGNPSLPPCDPSLWLLHYMPAEPNHRFPASRVPILPAVSITMQQRTYLQRYGQLIRKDFMLHDRSNWPVISVPSAPPQAPPVMASAYPGNVIQHLNRGQQPGYPVGMQQPGSVGPSPAKRQRQMASSSRPGNAASAGAVMSHEAFDEEDVSRGDLMDFLSPREISSMRYTQHHEWIEEIFSSPYATSQIIPVDLGLGRKGELEALTSGFFDAPTDKIELTKVDLKDLKDHEVQMSRLGPERAEEFATRATEKLKSLQAEMERMKTRHERRMAKIGRHSAIYEADKRLQSLDLNPIGKCIPVQPGETSVNDPARGAATIAVLHQLGKIDDIEREVATKLDRQIQAVNGVTCVDKGGLEEKTEAEARHEQASLQAIPLNRATPPHLPPHNSGVPSINAPTDYSSNSASNQPSSYPTPQPLISTTVTPPITIPTLTLPHEPSQPHPPPDDWVMVDQPPATSTAQSDFSTLAAPSSATPPIADFSDAALGAAADTFNTTPLANDDVFGDIDFDGMDTAGDELANFEAGAADDAFGDAAAGMGEEEVGGMGEMVFATETGGEAQGQAGDGVGGAGGGGGGGGTAFDGEIGGGDDDDGLDGDMVMEDSAFGDAFLEAEPGEEEADGGSV